MSATARATATRPVSPRAASRPEPRRRTPLREVPAPAPVVAGNGMFTLIVMGLLLGGMVMLLVLNTSLAQGAFEIGSLSRTQRDLAVQEQRLLQQVALEESPEALQLRADALGMVPASTPVFLRLADGAVLGKPRPAKANPATTKTGTGTAADAGTATTTASATDAATPTDERASDGTSSRSNARSGTSDAAVADAPVQSDAAVLDSGTGAR